MDLIPVRELLGLGLFEIPDYQRGYSWGEQQVEDFIEDLEEVNNVSEHYTGTFTILYKGNEKRGFETYPKYDIVDGQQRLITICILISCIHFKAKESKVEEADLIKYIIKNGKAILSLNGKDQDFFYDLLHENSISKLNNINIENKTQKNLINTKKYISKRLNRFSERKLSKVFENLLNKFKLNVFKVEDENRVGLIFETMNDRGLPLSDIDKIKNYLIYTCHRLNELPLAREVNRDFGEIFKNLIKLKKQSNIIGTESDFLKKCYIVYSGDWKDLNDIHKKVKNELITKYSPDNNKKLFTSSKGAMDKKSKQIREFKLFLLKASKEYVRLLNCESENIVVKEKLKRLTYLDYLDSFMPLLLAATLNKNFHEHYLEEILNILEGFTVRVLGIEGRKSNIGQNNLYDIAFKIKNNEINYTKTKIELRKLVKDSSTLKDFKEEIIRHDFYSRKSNSLIKLLLFEYELMLRTEQKEGLIINFEDDYTVEHIAPQTPLSGDEKIKNIHCLGNLVLTQENKKLDNKLFRNKKRIYQRSVLLSEQELVEYNDWNDRTIIERGRKLHQFINKKWRLN